MINRIEPALPVSAMQTFRIQAPTETHYAPATCEQVGCDAHRLGWITAVDESTTLGQMQAHHIRHNAGRRYVEERGEDGLTRFTFEAGQDCFRSGDHRRRLDRPEVYTVHAGDHRGLHLLRRHVSPDDWVEDFAEHQDKIKSQMGE